MISAFNNRIDYLPLQSHKFCPVHKACSVPANEKEDLLKKKTKSEAFIS
jgi:hypothetical protein